MMSPASKLPSRKREGDRVSGNDGNERNSATLGYQLTQHRDGQIDADKVYARPR
jgi:hypothetical protein